MTLEVANAKSIFTSKTFYGAILALIAVLIPGTYEHILTAIGIADPGVIADKIVGGIGGALAIYGRFVATKVTTVTGTPSA